MSNFLTIQRTPSRPRSAGFTLLELMVGIAVVGVLVALAAPSFTGTINRARAQAARDALHQSIVLARTEAIRTGQAATFAPVGGNWSSGWTVTLNGAVIREVSDLQNITVTGGPASYVVGPRGNMALVGFVVTAGTGSVQGQSVLCISPGGRLQAKDNTLTC